MSVNTNYIGNELELFSHAVNWKKYWGSKVSPFLGTHVLEVGAGIGTNTKHLLASNTDVEKWVCIEPDGQLADNITVNLSENYNNKVSVIKGYLKNYETSQKFDSILYIDVIEHLKDDKAELDYAKSFLKDNGYLIVLVPAHNYLFSDFDKAIGHYRRYNKSMLKTAVGKDLIQEKLMYLDSVGMLASTVNKLFLKQSYPTINQIKFWDNYIIKTSLISDTILMNSLGKTLLGIWKKEAI